MAFSLFGKKDKPPTKKKTSTGGIKKRGEQAHKPAPPAEPVGVKKAVVPRSTGEFSLDFSQYAPPLSTKVKAAAPPLAKMRPGPAGEENRAPRGPTGNPAAPVRHPPATIPTAPAASPPPATQALNVEVTGSTAATAPVVEEAAILFANGQSMQALAVLDRAVKLSDLGTFALKVWLMLLDLYQYLGMKAEFEALGMEFLVRFERSPPVWVAPEAQFSSVATGGIGYCALTGVLSDASASQIEQLRRMGERQQAMRIDFAKLQGVDSLGCARLLEALNVLKARGKDVVFTGEAHLLSLLEAQCQTKEAEGVLWSLRFEMLRRLGLKDRFEDDAVNYAVIYEVSPPSWPSAAWSSTGGRTEGKRKAGPIRGRVASETEQPAFRLSGDVTGANEGLPKELQDWAASNSPVVIDMSAVRRVDFVSTGLLLNSFTRLHKAGVTIQIRGANELVAALFEVMGIGKVARIIGHR